MVDIPVTLNVFERTDFNPDRCGKGRREIGEIDPDRRRFLRIVRRVFAENNFETRLNGHKWPIGEGAKGTYNYLKKSPYSDAEFSIAFVDGISHAGPEIGSLVFHSGRKLRHCMVVASNRVDSSFALEIRKGLRSVAPLHLFESEAGGNTGRLITKARDNTSTVASLDAEQSGFISFFDIQSMNDDKSISRLHSVIAST